MVRVARIFIICRIWGSRCRDRRMLISRSMDSMGMVTKAEVEIMRFKEDRK